MQPYVLGIDIGTGSTKAVAVDVKGKVIGASQSHYPEGTSSTRQDPEMIWNAFVDVVQHMLLQTGMAPEAISFSSAMHSIMAVDAQSQLLSDLITWADNGAAGIAIHLAATPLGRELYEQCGTPIHAFSPLCKIRWWQENDPALVKSTAKFIGIKEWIWHRLFGVYEIDYSLASATGMMDVYRKEWYTPALAYAGIYDNQLSQLVDTRHKRTGMFPEATGIRLPQPIPFMIGASDGCLANLGTAALEKGIAAITIGTSGAVRVGTRKPKAVYPEQLFNYYLDGDHWITGGAINNGGAAVQWISRLLGAEQVNEEQIAAINQIEPGAEGLLFLPYLLGERAPLWDSNSSAAFIGLRQHHKPAHLIRAVIEGICFSLRSVLAPLEKAAGEVHTLHLSGGFTRSEAALQVLSDCLGKKVVLLQSEDASAIGAAFLALQTLNYTTLPHQIPPPGMIRTFTPNTVAHERYTNLFAIYQPLYGLLKNTMHQLRAINQAT